ncbi:hypothetical protein QVH35_07340 [Candidatus Nitrosotenuis chungbukensis]|uniref:hypothetical protein n=1 Tax=Candidatus Nitrosotenuis chungbukensis TaxID=1353246 RepID=UPI0026736728|nr:hypothetical protein [Candidatus Nitrosotenuis chungbukensis]WKT57240.1 hypothetical protein QVH35_07340 [Candidatus Nitrosotenuis chungbukensis]
MAKIGCVAGLVGGFALFSSFFWIDSEVGVPFGTFYKMVGMAVGLHGLYAIAFGFIAHMLVASLIGATFCICSIMHKMLHISSVPKGIVAGAVTGIEVYAIFFMPITIYVMMPMIADHASGLYAVTEGDMQIARTLVQASDKILWGSLVLHVLFGAVMGLFSSMMLYEDYNMKQKEKKRKSQTGKSLRVRTGHPHDQILLRPSFFNGGQNWYCFRTGRWICNFP